MIKLALLLLSCTSHPKQAAPGEAFMGNALEVLEAYRIPPEESLRVTLLHQNADHTVNLVQVNNRVKPHYHETHDEVAYILEGGGLFSLKDVQREVKPGDFQIIPRGAVHSFENAGPGPSAVLSFFSPKFDGEDRIFPPPK